MIDPHVHLRDWNESAKETVKHGLELAYDSGLSGVFEMPNTNPAMISRELLLRRIDLADSVFTDIFHGIYGGLTADLTQLEEMVNCHRELFPRIVGFKLFAGKSTGNLSVPELARQRAIFRRLTELDYRGLVAVHCEKESLFRPELWNPAQPLTHSLARAPIAELRSVEDMLSIISETGFQGILHIAHISTDAAVKTVIKHREKYPDARVTCGVTAHHLFLSAETIPREKALLAKVNPPLRSQQTRLQLLQHLKNGDIDWIETDHAPHSKEDKFEKYLSGIPALPIYCSLEKQLTQAGVSSELFQKITHDNINKAFGLQLKNRREPNFRDRKGDYWGWIFD